VTIDVTKNIWLRHDRTRTSIPRIKKNDTHLLLPEDSAIRKPRTTGWTTPAAGEEMCTEENGGEKHLIATESTT
jgi:hypothetical protein